MLAPQFSATAHTFPFIVVTLTPSKSYIFFDTISIWDNNKLSDKYESMSKSAVFRFILLFILTLNTLTWRVGKENFSCGIFVQKYKE